MAKLSFKNVAKYYGGEYHQDLALEYLDKAMPPEILEQFTELWRGKSPEEEKKPIVVTPTGLRGADPLAQKVVDYYGNKGWRIKKPSHGGYEVLLVGFEGATRTGNKTFVTNNDSPTGNDFNDLIGVFLVDKHNQVSTANLYTATTEPGLYYTRNRLNPAGAARIQIDFLQRDVWQVGSHKGREEALVQTGGAIMVTRDGNQDFMRTGDQTMTGYYGINLHSARNSGKIGRWSAGCQVVQMSKDLASIMSYVKNGDGFKNNRKFKYDFACLDAALFV